MPPLMQRLADFTHLQDPHRRQSFRDLHPCSYVLLYVTMLVLLGGHSRALPGQAPAEGNEGVRVRKEFTNSLGMKFVELPGTPVVISIWETRVSDWEAYLSHNGTTWRNSPAFSQTAQDPAANITLPEAMEFCIWLTNHERSSGLITADQTYRLPGKSEWDAAAGITADGKQSSALYPWGNEWPPMRQSGNYGTRRIAGGRDDGFEFTAPVGQFFPSRSGCFDLGGNVCEWTSDVDRSGETAIALRGGSWMYWRRECLETQYVHPVPATIRSPGVGFRCVLEDAAEMARVARDREQSASKLMEQPIVDQKEVEEMRRKLMERRQPKKDQEPTQRPAAEAPATK